jgi:L-aspartate oxidase
MTANCGVRRSAKRLNQLLGHIEDLIEQVGRANPLMASKMIAASALAREESRGGHYRDDFPKPKDDAVSSYITFDMLD